MKTSETIKEIAPALAKAAANISNAAKDGHNPHFKSAYTTLAIMHDDILGEMVGIHGGAYHNCPQDKAYKALKGEHFLRIDHNAAPIGIDPFASDSREILRASPPLKSAE